MISNQKSTTMWSQPSTPKEQRYFSKHSIKRKVYGIAQFVLQNAHIALAFGAWAAIYSHALRSFPAIQWLVTPLALVSLGILHLVYKTTSDAFWYDRLDDDKNTDSSPIIPLVILLILLVTEQHGASMLFKNAVTKAAEKDDTHIITSTSAEIADQKKLYGETVAEINAKYAPLLAAKSAKYDSEIASWERKSTISDNDMAFKRKNIAQVKSRRADGLASLEAAKAAEISKAADVKNTNIQKITDRKDAAISSIATHNDGERQRYSIETDQAGSMAWLVSSALILLISALGYARVRINVKSGILPIRQFTELDQHGGLFELLGIALGDAFKRRATQYTTLLHRKLSPSQAIQTIDGTVITTPGTYNNFDVQLTPPPAPNVVPAGGDKTNALQNNMAKIETAIMWAVKVFYASSDNNEQIENWQMIYHLRTQAHGDGFITYIKKNGLVEVWQNECNITLKEMLDLYPFPPVEKKEAVATTPPATKKQPEYDVVYNAKPLSDLPDGFEYQDDNTILFKQDQSLFKQQQDGSGRVIGLLYKGVRAEWTALGYSQVLSYFNTYKRRAADESSEASQHGYDKWTWALSLFNQAPNQQSETIKPIR